jgi:serine/threonine-protein kinase
MQATLSHYRILEQVGAGRSSVVFLAYDEHMRRDVALKVLSPGTTVDVRARKRFHQEALTLSQLNHPNIATVHDFGTEDGADFLVEEFIEGRSLDIILARGPLPENEIVHFGVQIGEGLAAAHAQGVIHRDLKPANVLITGDARLKIVDFGLAMIVRHEVSPMAATESVSETSVIAGTLPYMAPEQLLGGKLDARTDIWAAGCVLYEMATGIRPFAGSGPALTDAILHSLPAPVVKLNSNISAPLDGVIQKCLDKNPARRYQSAREVVVDLQRTVSVPQGTAMARRLKLPAIVVAVGTLLLALASIGIRLQTKHPRNSAGGPRVEVSALKQMVPHELYLAGLKQLERWDKADSLEAAIVSFQQVVQDDPNFALGFSALGEAYWAKYRLDDDSRWLDAAEENCRRAAGLNTELPAVYVTLARVHNGRGQYDLALQEIQHALKLEPLDANALLTMGEVYAAVGRNAEAESAYRKATVLRPQYWDGHYELGVFYFRSDRYPDAGAQFERALELSPDNAMVHATLGGVMQLLGKDVDAEKHLRLSIQLQPSYAAYTNLGVLYYTQRRYSESVAMTRKALDINATDWKAWSNLGLAYLWLGRESQAGEAFRHELACLEEIAKVKTDDPQVQVELGLLYSKKKLHEEAVSHIEAALARSADDPAVLVSAAEAYENLGDRARALQLVARAMAKGWTLAQLQNDPGQQQLIQDPRFHNTMRQLK